MTVEKVRRHWLSNLSKSGLSKSALRSSGLVGSDAEAVDSRRAVRRVDSRRAVKPVDAWWTVVVIDPIAVRLLSFLLVLDWVTPNLVTGVAFVVGGGAIALFALGHFIAGALLYELRFLLDCLDGKIARVRGTSSPLGAAFDRTADSLTVPAAYAVIGLVLVHQGHMPASFALAPALCGAVLTVLELSLDLLLLRSARPGPVEAPYADGPSSVVGRVALWMGRHRLRLLPWTVEIESVGLFLGPLFLRGVALGDLELALAGIYLLCVVFDLGQIGRVAAA